MSTTTPNLGLIKPALTDVADIADINANLDTLDGHTHLGCCGGRLTLTSGVGVTTADVTAASNLYFTPYKGNRIALYDGTKWVEKYFSELTLPLATFTANTNYDVFIYDNTGTLSLDKVAWSSGTARATSLTLQDGVYAKSGTGNSKYRYLGTIRTTATAGQCEDSAARRFVWNYYNGVGRLLCAVDTTNSWSYTSSTIRASNNNTTDGVGRVSFVVGVAEILVEATHVAAAKNDTQISSHLPGIALDATNANHAQIRAAYQTASTEYCNLTGVYRGYPAAGYHYLQKTEAVGIATGTSTWLGDVGGTITQTGLVGSLMG